jgi:hypothetical protein
VVALLRVLGTFLIGFAALAVLAWGWIVWLPLAARLGAGRDPRWQLGAFAVLLAADVAVAAGLWRVHDVLTRRLDYRGPALAERRYCQRCGAALPATEPACRACGSTRLGPAPPPGPRAAGEAPRHPTGHDP